MKTLEELKELHKGCKKETGDAPYGVRKCLPTHWIGKSGKEYVYNEHDGTGMKNHPGDEGIKEFGGRFFRELPKDDSPYHLKYEQHYLCYYELHCDSGQVPTSTSEICDCKFKNTL